MADLCTFDSSLTTFDGTARTFDATTCQDGAQPQPDSEAIGSVGDAFFWQRMRRQHRVKPHIDFRLPKPVVEIRDDRAEDEEDEILLHWLH